MQTKKRAKSVSFGKTKTEAEEKKPKEIEEVEEKEAKKPQKEEKVEVEEDAEDREEKETAKDEMESEAEDEPEEVSLKGESTEEDPTDEKVESDGDEEKEAKSVSVADTTSYEEPSPFGSFGRAPEEDKSSRGNAWFFLMVTLIAFVLGFACIMGIYHLSSNTSFDVKSIKVPDVMSKPTATPKPTQTPTPTPQSVDLTQYKIKVLNGTDTSGLAAKAKTALTAAGFTVSTTGNADTSDYTKTVIEAKKSVNQDYLNQLITELKKTYQIQSNITVLSTSDASDVTVIIGTSNAQ